MKVATKFFLVLVALVALVAPAFAGGPMGDKYNVWPSLKFSQVVWDRHQQPLPGPELVRSGNNGELMVRKGQSFTIRMLLNDFEGKLKGVRLRSVIDVSGDPSLLRERRYHGMTIYTAVKSGPVYITAVVNSLQADVKFKRTVEETVNIYTGQMPTFRLEAAYEPHADGTIGGLLSAKIVTNVVLTGVEVYVFQSGDELNINLHSDQGYAWSVVRMPIPYAYWSADAGTTSFYQSWMEGGVIKSSATRLDDGIMNGGVKLPMAVPVTTADSSSGIFCSVTPAKG